MESDFLLIFQLNIIDPGRRRIITLIFSPLKTKKEKNVSMYNLYLVPFFLVVDFFLLLLEP